MWPFLILFLQPMQLYLLTGWTVFLKVAWSTAFLCFAAEWYQQYTSLEQWLCLLLCRLVELCLCHERHMLLYCWHIIFICLVNSVTGYLSCVNTALLSSFLSSNMGTKICVVVVANLSCHILFRIKSTLVLSASSDPVCSNWDGCSVTNFYVVK